MVDIKLDKSGDIVVSDIGDFSLTESVRQAVVIRLRWIHDEWRFGPEYGFPWYEEMWVKNPNITKLKSMIRSEIMQVEGVTDARIDEVEYKPGARSAKFRFTCCVGEAAFREEVELYA